MSDAVGWPPIRRQRIVGAAQIERQLDQISLEYPAWRFNLRRSNTEPVVRLNVESRGDAGLVAARLAEIAALLTG